MGKFTYDSGISTGFEDRALAHLQAVILAKVRRGEGFCLGWKDDPGLGGGRTSVYIHARSTISFTYDTARTPALNPLWLNALTRAANSPQGLSLLPEPRASRGDEPGGRKPAGILASAEA